MRQRGQHRPPPQTRPRLARTLPPQPDQGGPPHQTTRQAGREGQDQGWTPGAEHRGDGQETGERRPRSQCAGDRMGDHRWPGQRHPHRLEGHQGQLSPRHDEKRPSQDRPSHSLGDQPGRREDEGALVAPRERPPHASHVRGEDRHTPHQEPAKDPNPPNGLHELRGDDHQDRGQHPPAKLTQAGGGVGPHPHHGGCHPTPEGQSPR